jgi:hypothetical protein
MPLQINGARWAVREGTAEGAPAASLDEVGSLLCLKMFPPQAYVLYVVHKET